MSLQRNLAQAFDSIPASKFSYKPTPAQLTIGYTAQHLESDNSLFCNAFGAMKATLPASDTTTADTVKATWPKDSQVAKLKASLTFCESAFAQLDDTKLGEQVTMTFGANSRTVSRVSMVLGHALDMSDHYSQLADYMRGGRTRACLAPQGRSSRRALTSPNRRVTHARRTQESRACARRTQ